MLHQQVNAGSRPIGKGEELGTSPVLCPAGRVDTPLSFALIPLSGLAKNQPTDRREEAIGSAVYILCIMYGLFSGNNTGGAGRINEYEKSDLCLCQNGYGYKWMRQEN